MHANTSHLHQLNLYWDVGKAFLRYKRISYVTYYKTNTELCLHTAQFLLYQSNTQDNIKAWHEAKRSFNTWAKHQEHLKFAHTDVHFQKYRNKAGKLLSRPLQTNTHHCMKRYPGMDFLSPPEISKILETYYITLYATDPTNPQKATNL